MKLPSFLQDSRVPTTLCIMAVALAVLTVSARLPVLYDIQQRIEALAFDARMRVTLPENPELDPQVVIVDIDEKSLAAEGHWPWPRTRLGQLVQAIAAEGAAVIAFDSVYAEAERNAAAEIIRTVGEEMDPAVRAAVASYADRVDADRAFAGVMAQYPVVLGFTFTQRAGIAQGVLPAPTVHYAGSVDDTSVMRMPAYVGNVPVLQQAASAGGFVTVTPDADGVIRRVPTVLRFGDTLYASLALEAVRLALGADGIEVKTRDVGGQQRIDRVSIGGMVDIPTDGTGQLIVPFQGASPRFLYVSAADLLHGAVEAGVMEGSIVLVGATAEGMKDLRATPMQAVYPGVEIHATIISALFGAGFPVAPSWALGADVAIILFVGLGAALLFPRLTPVRMIGVAFFLLAAVTGLNLWLWSAQQLVLSLATPLLVIATVTFIHVDAGFLSEARSRRSLRDTFGQYVPASLVEQMYADPDKDFGFEGESREMSVLFSDIRGFTTISESLEPQALKQFLNEYFTPVTGIIFRHNGTIDKYVGDMVMAFWGAPLRDEEHRSHAVAAALDMLDALPGLQQAFAARGWPAVDVGIGINTGWMNVGDMGSSFRRSYTVIGDAVNLGSRLEGLTKYYGVRLLVSDAARDGVTGVAFRHLDRVRVKGKAEPVDIFEVCCREPQLTPALREELAAHGVAMEHYFAGRWDAAAAAFALFAQAGPQRRCHGILRERIDALREQRPEGHWDGVFEHTSK